MPKWLEAGVETSDDNGNYGSIGFLARLDSKTGKPDLVRILGEKISMALVKGNTIIVLRRKSVIN